MWQERADYGHFFYRIPNGESAADAYDRVSGFNESLWRQFGEDDFASVCVLVTHGLMSRVFLMKWYHFSVEYFEDLRNVNHCEFLTMRHQDNGKYHLENQLRTWSELRRERALKEGKEAPAKIERSKTFTATRRWGGCPNGCNHSRHYKKREDLEVLRQKDVENAVPGSSAVPSPPKIISPAVTTNGASKTIAARRQRLQRTISSDDDYDNDEQPSGTKTIASGIDLARIRSIDGDEPQSSPEIVLRYPHHLHVGRDFGGTYSGHTSTAGSDTEASEDENHRNRRLASLDARIRAKAASALRSQTPAAEDSSSSNPDHHHHVCANRLGDVPTEDGDGDVDVDLDEDLDKAEEKDRSIRGSVY